MSLRLSARMLSGLTTRCNTAAVCASSLMFETEKFPHKSSQTCHSAKAWQCFRNLFSSWCVFEFTTKVSNKNFNYPLSFATRPALQLRKAGLSFRPNFSSLLFFKQKKKIKIRSRFLSLSLPIFYDVRSKIYIPYPYSLSIYWCSYAREKTPRGYVEVLSFLHFKNPLGFC